MNNTYYDSRDKAYEAFAIKDFYSSKIGKALAIVSGGELCLAQYGKFRLFQAHDGGLHISWVEDNKIKLGIIYFDDFCKMVSEMDEKHIDEQFQNYIKDHYESFSQIDDPRGDVWISARVKL